MSVPRFFCSCRYAEFYTASILKECAGGNTVKTVYSLIRESIPNETWDRRLKSFISPGKDTV